MDNSTPTKLKKTVELMKQLNISFTEAHGIACEKYSVPQGTMEPIKVKVILEAPPNQCAKVFLDGILVGTGTNEECNLLAGELRASEHKKQWLKALKTLVIKKENKGAKSQLENKH